MATEAAGNKTAVFALTAGGARLGRDLAPKIKARLFLPARLEDAGGNEDNVSVNYFSSFSGTVKEVFFEYDRIIFIMAAGIVVRTIAPLLVSKHTDPAVVVMDEAGEFAVSLVSGHVGGANRLCREISTASGTVPVITTATDVNKRPAVDELAAELDCVPVPPGKVKEFNRALAEKENVKIVSRWPSPDNLRHGFDDSAELKIEITDRVESLENNTLYLLPKNLVAGIGCRRDTPGEAIVEALENVLGNIPGGKKRIKAIATASVKEGEKGIYHAARYFDVPVRIISRQEIENLPVDYEKSEFVKKTVGVGGVCEPAAIIASGGGKVLIPKTKAGPVTAAVAAEKLWWWE